MCSLLLIAYSVLDYVDQHPAEASIAVIIVLIIALVVSWVVGIMKYVHTINKEIDQLQKGENDSRYW